MNEQTTRAFAHPHSAPVAWLRAAATATDDPVRAAIELVLANPEAVAEIIDRAPPTAFTEAMESGRARHDGWTNDRIATFLELLADTGLITESCRIVGMSREAAYALRNRDPVFAAAMRAAQAKARPHVADGLLERSITGTVEHYYRDGVLVGERRHYESWLGLAVLKRLDKQSADDRAEGALAVRMEDDWQEVVETLRNGGTAAVPTLLNAKLDKVDIPPPPGCDDLAKEVWQAENGVWMTTFAPPPGFEGEENREFDGFNYYERACTDEEVRLIETSDAIAGEEEQAEMLAEENTRRDNFFDQLRAEIQARQPCSRS